MEPVGHIWMTSDFAADYPYVCRKVRRYGEEASPRGMKTRELRSATIVVDSKIEPYQNTLPFGCGRKLNAAIGVAEALQLIGGVSHPELMRRISGNFGMFMDGGVLHGAYGPRIRNQLPKVVERLHDAHDTRQAVLNIWDPAYDLHTASQTPHDVPCTVFLQFLVRDGLLELHVHMRSNDVWWGLAYDAFQFTQLQYAVANVLSISPGRYVHNATSLHAYERDWDKIDVLEPYDATKRGPSVSLSAMHRRIGIEEVMGRARSLLRGQLPAETTAGERWMLNQLEPYL